MRIRQILITFCCVAIAGCDASHTTSTPMTPAASGTPIVLPPLEPGARAQSCIPRPKKKRQVTLYNAQNPKTSYRVIGSAQVLRHDSEGTKRDDATLNKMLEAHAEAQGGDGLVDVTSDHNGLKGNVIAYERALF